MNESIWYQELIRPDWAPPAWLFGPVWTVLYALIAITFGYTFWLYIKKKIPLKVLAPFLLNLIFNFIFTPLQFGLKNNLLAAIDILFALVTLVWLMIAIYPYKKWITWLNVPYLLWVSFATVLQLTITYLNW